MLVNNILQAPIEWDPVDVTPQLKNGKTVIPDKAIDSVRKNFVALKGPLAVGILILCSMWIPNLVMGDC